MQPLPIRMATAACTALALGSLASAAQIDWNTIDGGGTMSSEGADFSLSGTIGQPDAGTMIGGDFELTGGFWTGGSATGPVPGDCDVDGDVDLDDAASFPGCLSGPASVYGPPACACIDFDGNGIIDLADFAAFQVAFTQ